MPEEIIFNPTLEEPECNLTSSVKEKFAKEIESFLEIMPSFEQTYVIVTAHHKESGRNYINRISCEKGLPIGGYTYDSQTDSYHIECSDYLHLGYIPVSFVARIKGMQHWEMRTPMPEALLSKYLTSLQKKELRNFKNHFKEELYEIQYIQMIDPN